MVSAGHAYLRDFFRPKKELPSAAFTFAFSLYLLKSHFRESYKSVTATKMEILHFWNEFLNWSYLWEWSENGATALQMYWWTGLVFFFPAHCDCRAHIIIYSQSFRDGAKSRWYLNAVLKMQNKYLNIKFSGNFPADTAAIIQMEIHLCAYFGDY